MLRKSIELPPGEQKRILGAIDLTLDNRQANGSPKDEAPYVTLLWGIMGELRAFCQLLGQGMGMKQVVALEKVAAQAKVTTPAVLLFELYRIVKATKTERALIMPKWLDEVIADMEGENEEAEEETKPSQ